MLIHQRIAENDNSTVSILEIRKDGSKLNNKICYLLEDGYRLIKEDGKTRINPGIYRLRQRTVGRFFENYRSRFGHAFSIEIENCGTHTDVLLHGGNTIADTRGCPLVGQSIEMLPNSDFKISPGDSIVAYRALYNILLPLWRKDKAGNMFIDYEVRDCPTSIGNPLSILR